VHQGRSIIAAYLGFFVPGAAAFILLPEIINNLGSVRFAYFSNLYSYSVLLLMLDLGISAGISRRVSAALNIKSTNSRVSNLIWSAIYAQIMIAVVVVIGSAIFSAFMTFPTTADIPKKEIIIAYIAITLSAAPAMFCSVFRGAYEGSGRHYSASFIRASSSITALLIPAILPLITADLGIIFSAILVLRICIALVAGFSIQKTFGKPIFKSRNIIIKYIKVLLGESALLSIGHLAGSLITLGLIDRFFLTNYVDPSLLIDYVLPRDMVIRLLLIPSAMCVVLMPYLAGKYHPKNSSNADLLSLQNLFSSQAWPVCGLLILWSESIIIYLSDGMAGGTAVSLFVLMSLGVFLNLNAFIFHTLLIATGNIWRSARRHLMQLPFIILCSFYLAVAGNLEALGFLWLSFCIGDVIMTFIICRNLSLLPRGHKPISKRSLLLFFGLLLLLLLSTIQVISIKILISIFLATILLKNINDLRNKSEVFGFE
jgi:O-antigen/teichoic acid export membrane protein